jgi:hypothetical protein
LAEVRYWHLADNSAVLTFVRYWTTADKAGFEPAVVCPLMTQSGHCEETMVTELRNDINSPDTDLASDQLKNALARDLAEVPFQPR